MSEKSVLIEIDKPHFTVRLYERFLVIDVKGTLKDEIEEALENKPILRETLGHILGIFAPLHIRLSDIDSVNMDKMGTVRIHLPHHRDVVISLEPKEAKRLINKLNELIPEAKEDELERIIKEHKLQRIVEEEQLMEKEEEIMPMGGAQMPISEPPGTREKIKEAEKKIIEEEQR
ncbi:MAG: hypothetical protein QXW63_00040 [Candidatus Bathyarchaeia archaeon]